MEPSTDDTPDLVWNVGPISKEIGRSPRQTSHLLESRQLPGSFKIGRAWVLDRNVFRRRVAELTGEAA